MERKFPIPVRNDGLNREAWNSSSRPTVDAVDRKGVGRYGRGELNCKGADGEGRVRKLVAAPLTEKS